MPKNKRRITIDASVARAAGDVSMHPISKGCRDALRCIAATSLEVATCSTLIAEWRKHQSNFSRAWMLSMVARGRFTCLEPEPRDEILRDKIEAHAATERCAQSMIKDAHLLEVALNSDKRIIALDEVVRSLFKEFSQHHHPIKQVLWANPTIPEDSTLEWIKNHCPTLKNLKIGHQENHK